jgi:hypothetical protein
MTTINTELLKQAQLQAKEVLEDYKTIQANLEFYIVRAWIADKELMEFDLEQLEYNKQ